MRSDPTSLTASAYATLRVAGDDLDPADLDTLLATEPTSSWRKGEAVETKHSGRSAPKKTGMWLLKTTRYIHTKTLADHIKFVGALLGLRADGAFRSGKAEAIRDALASRGLRLTVLLFWHGHEHASEPSIPDGFRDLISFLGGSVMTDFAVDEPEAVATPFADMGT